MRDSLATNDAETDSGRPIAGEVARISPLGGHAGVALLDRFLYYSRVQPESVGDEVWGCGPKMLRAIGPD